MTREPGDWRTSPHAAEFLPDEIDQLELGAMVLCGECLWPRPRDGGCKHCATHNAERTRETIDEFPGRALIAGTSP